jgi:hypothetical protein
MNNVPVRFVGLLILVVAVVAAGPVLADGALEKGVETLSAESFEGRGAGTDGLDRALEYIEKRFAEVGLQPIGADGYRQSFDGPDGTTLVNLVGVLGAVESKQHAIIGAHYDHLGMGEGTANEGSLHPGADDNASGVAVLLECARRLAGEELAHPVIFIAFAGEETGLLGSAHYVNNPVKPLAGCVAMVNLDTVGRLEDGPLTVFGTKTANEMPHVIRGVNYGVGFELEMPDEDPEEPMAFVPPGAEKMAASAPSSGGSGRRVSFGSIPDFNHTGEGVLVDGVIPGSPAEQAGIQKGDLLVEFAGISIEDLRSFSDILKGLEPGEKVSVVYVRGGERHEAIVKVVERK